ncbi:hypothetical protein [Thauera butanivorans]|uniref:hypothetical protein n=1 Tax=Thauera butanivorans TaxID=86174 RepID=UPI000AF370CA|nr:hypothetical protein [Thauera butanivorans]
MKHKLANWVSLAALAVTLFYWWREFIAYGIFVLIVFLIALAKAWYDISYLEKKKYDLDRQLASGIVLRPYALLLKSGGAVNALHGDLPNPNYKYSVRILEPAVLPGFFRRVDKLLAPTAVKLVNDPTDKLADFAQFDYSKAWQSEIIKDFADSILILVVPIAMSEGVRWELDYLLQNRLLWKVIFVMPAQVDGGSSIEWRRAARELRRRDILLPVYRPSGGLACQTADRQFGALVPWDAASDELLIAVSRLRRLGQGHAALSDYPIPIVPAWGQASEAPGAAFRDS